MSEVPYQASSDEFEQVLRTVSAHIVQRYRTLEELDTIPDQATIARTIDILPDALPANGLGTTETTSFLINKVLPGCLQGQPGPRYFGFVCGGVTPASQLGDILATSYDENACVTLPQATAATAIEARTLEMVLDLLHIDREAYLGRTITTGATSSNVLGLACARDHLYSVSPHLPPGYSFSQDGPPTGLNIPSPPIVIFGLFPHFSVTKAASLVGLGGGPKVVQQLPAAVGDDLTFDMIALKSRLKEEKSVGRGVIVTFGLGEVNTGGFGCELEQVAKICKQYGAWLHVDAAFGGFAAAVPESRYLTKGIELADSLTLDGHKWLNVPYDCGLFFTRDVKSLTRVFAPPDLPAYLTVSNISDGSDSVRPGAVNHANVPTPLYVNIENSRRFRALPLFASLLSLGQNGYADVIRRNMEFARQVAQWLRRSPQYELLNASTDASQPVIPLNIVLFRGSPRSPFPPSDPLSASALAAKINETRRIYVSGTKWRGNSAVRLAVSNWRTGLGGDVHLNEVLVVLRGVVE